MGAGLQRWWLAGSYESECEAYDRKQRLRNWERGMFSWAFDHVAAGLTLEEMNQMFPHPRAAEGFELLCVRHGIYGRRDRGDQCGPCKRSDEAFEMFGINTASYERWRDGDAGEQAVGVGASGIEFVVDERLAPGEHYVLPKKMWNEVLMASTPARRSKVSDMLFDSMRFGIGLAKLKWDADAVNPNKEVNVENEVRSAGPMRYCKKCQTPIGPLGSPVEIVDNYFFHPKCAEKKGIALPQTHTLRPCDRCKQTMECEPMELADGRLMHPGCWAKIEPTQPLAHKHHDSLHAGCHECHLKIHGGLLPVPPPEYPPLRALVFQAIGKASTLFSGEGGVFDDRRAVEIAEWLIGEIEMLEPEPIDVEMYPGTHWSARQLPNAHAFVLESRNGDSIVVPFEMVARFFEYREQGERIGDQLRRCHCCDKEQKVDAFNLSVEPHKFVGPFGDAENMYVCDACAPDVLKAVRRVRDGKAPTRAEPHDIDLIAGDE